MVLAAGCTDLPTPAELARPQVLAVRADPPALPAGERAELTVLVAGPDGAMTDLDVTWAVAEPTPQLPAIGDIEVDGDGRVWYVAPDEVDEVTGTSVEATVRVDDETTLIALKGVAVGVAMPTVNPIITDLFVGGDSVDDGGTATLSGDEPVSLDIAVDPPGSNNATTSWYATLGEIELYRRTPTEILPAEEPGNGSLFVVYRDERGGVTWRAIGVTFP